MSNLAFQAPERATYVPLHAFLVPLPLLCFAAALVTDIIYARTSEIQWANFSAWLLAAGLALGFVAGIVGLIDLLRTPSTRRPAVAWLHMVGNVVALALALVNSFVHARDGWTSVVPTGVILSAVTFLTLIVTSFFGVRMAPLFRRGAKS